MPEFDFIRSVGPLILSAASIALVLAIAIALVGFWLTEKKYLETLIFILPYGLLGAVIGFIAGSSREELVGALLTGVLTIVGALLSYAFSKDAATGWRDLLPYSVGLLALTALAGLGLGQFNRVARDQYERDYARWQIQYEKADIPAMAVKIRFSDCIARVTPEHRADCDKHLLE